MTKATEYMTRLNTGDINAAAPRLSSETKTVREAVATELVAHGEFSASGNNNYPNALLAADQVIKIVLAHTTNATLAGAAQAALIPAGRQAKYKGEDGEWFQPEDDHNNPENFDYRNVYAISSTSRATEARPTVIGKVSGKPREGDQVPGMPGAICHACGLGYKCDDADCPNTKPNPMFGGVA